MRSPALLLPWCFVRHAASPACTVPPSCKSTAGHRWAQQESKRPVSQAVHVQVETATELDAHLLLGGVAFSVATGYLDPCLAEVLHVELRAGTNGSTRLALSHHRVMSIVSPRRYKGTA